MRALTFETYVRRDPSRYDLPTAAPFPTHFSSNTFCIDTLEETASSPDCNPSLPSLPMSTHISNFEHLCNDTESTSQRYLFFVVKLSHTHTISSISHTSSFERYIIIMAIKIDDDDDDATILKIPISCLIFSIHS